MRKFDYLAPYFGIIVTGPHRSGTTITGRMIAHDLDRRYITESQIQAHRNSLLDRRYMRDWIMAQDEPFVLHGATCFNWIDSMQGDNVATVFVWRPDREIRDSQGRAGDGFDNIAGKRARWKELIEAGVIANPFDVNYHDLHDHPLWEGDRDGWSKRQILPDETAYDTEGFRT